MRRLGLALLGAWLGMSGVAAAQLSNITNSFTGVQGNGAKVQLSTGSTTTNDCVKFDANGNTVDNGSACSGGGATYAVLHSYTGTGNPTCTASSGSNPSLDIYSGTLTGNGAPALPGSGCINNDKVVYDVSEGASAFTFVPTGTINVSSSCTLGGTAGNEVFEIFNWVSAASAWSETCGYEIPSVPATVPQGGTDLATLTAHGLVVGEGTSAVNLVTCAAGLPLLGVSSADPACSALSLSGSGVTGTLGAANGGTGLASPTAHGIPMTEGASAFNLLADVATGAVVVSGGTSADFTTSTTPNVTSLSTGTNPNCTAGTGGVLCATEGTPSTGLSTADELYANSTSHTWHVINNAGTDEQMVANSSGAAEVNISAGPYTFGNTTAPDVAAGQQVEVGTAVAACHFTKLMCVNVYHATTCTTAPTFNVFDGASNTGTPLTCSTSVQSTRGTISSQSQTQTIAAGDVYGIYLSTAGATCLTDLFKVSAEITCP